MNDLAEMREVIDDLHGAHQLYEQVLAGRRRVLGDDHPDTLDSMYLLAQVRRELERL
jgi:Tetratricopeptide repeat